MDGVYYLLSIIAIGVIIWWFVINDGRGDGAPTIGLLRMREPKETAQAPRPR